MTTQNVRRHHHVSPGEKSKLPPVEHFCSGTNALINMCQDVTPHQSDTDTIGEGDSILMITPTPGRNAGKRTPCWWKEEFRASVGDQPSDYRRAWDTNAERCESWKTPNSEIQECQGRAPRPARACGALGTHGSLSFCGIAYFTIFEAVGLKMQDWVS